MRRFYFQFTPVSKTGYDKTIQDLEKIIDTAIVQGLGIENYEMDPTSNCPGIVEGSIQAERNRLAQVLIKAVKNDQIEEFHIWR